MRLHRLFTSLLLLVTLNVCAEPEAQEVVPFADHSSVKEQTERKVEFETTGRFKVEPEAGHHPKSISFKDGPKIDNPIDFNRHFDRPFRIWRVDGGYFGAFDGGEWGGALFFAADNAIKWTRILDTHIQDLESFEGDTFLAAGGVAHLGRPEGKAYLVSRKPTGEWSARKVFSATTGVPRIIGISATNSFQKAESKKLIVLGLAHPLDREPLIGVDAGGAIHYLGERTKDDQSEQGAGHNRR